MKSEQKLWGNTNCEDAASAAWPSFWLAYVTLALCSGSPDLLLSPRPQS